MNCQVKLQLCERRQVTLYLPVHCRGLLEHMSFVQGPIEDSCSGKNVEDQEDKLDCKSDYYRSYIHLDLYYLLSYH